MTKFCTKCKLNEVHEISRNTWCKACKAQTNSKWHRENYIASPKVVAVECKACLTPKIDKVRFVGEFCRNCYEAKHRANNEDVKLKISIRNKTYRSENLDKRGVYESNRLRSNPSAKLANRFRNWINKLIVRKSGNAASLLGCSYDELKAYLEAKFQPGMTWENWGVHGWHIDHVKPLASFDLTDGEQQLKAFHYSNLQPLWAKDNLTKGSRYER